MDFTLPSKAFLRQHFDLKKLSGHEKFLALAAVLAVGKTGTNVGTQQIKKSWSKTALGIAYSDTYYQRAQVHGWVESVGAGRFTVTEHGITHLEAIASPGLATPSHKMPVLTIFTSGNAHTFDKFLRTQLVNAVSEVRIADSYVDETIFDNLLDQIPDTVIVYLLYGNARGNFDARVKRYKIQYKQFTAKHNEKLHDRFLVIDDTAYIIGPSLKDAARKSPALVVGLGSSDSSKLKKFFDVLWLEVR